MESAFAGNACLFGAGFSRTLYCEPRGAAAVAAALQQFALSSPVVDTSHEIPLSAKASQTKQNRMSPTVEPGNWAPTTVEWRSIFRVQPIDARCRTDAQVAGPRTPRDPPHPLASGRDLKSLASTGQMGDNRI